MALSIVPVWKQITPELTGELLELWRAGQVLQNHDRAVERAAQAVCVGRDASGAVCAVGTAQICVLPRLRQPMYYYRQFFAQSVRGQGEAIAFMRSAKRIVENYNRSLLQPESLGLLLELENSMLQQQYTRAYESAADCTFIGYSPRGFQLRVSYFEDARLLPPAPITRTRAVGEGASHAELSNASSAGADHAG